MPLSSPEDYNALQIIYTRAITNIFTTREDFPSELTGDQLVTLFDSLPAHIRAMAEEWNVWDDMFRDHCYKWLTQRFGYPNLNIFGNSV